MGRVSIFFLSATVVVLAMFSVVNAQTVVGREGMVSTTHRHATEGSLISCSNE